MKIAALIPARLSATRFHAKLLADIRGKTVIRRTYESVVATGLFDSVIVVADDPRLVSEIERTGGDAILSRGVFDSGTDCIAEVAADLDADIIVNVQGDEPFVQGDPLRKLVELFSGPDGGSIQVASPVQLLTDSQLIGDPDFVKVAMDSSSNALFFSRSVIPYPRNKQVAIPYYEHIGVYAFRKQALMDFATWQPTPLELAERIECLRFLEYGIPIRMVITAYMGVEIDTPGDIDRAEQLMDRMGWE